MLKTKFDKLTTDNYNYLLNSAKNICRKYLGREKDLHYTLLHSCIIKVYNDIHITNSFLNTDTDFRKYFNKYMKQHFHWEKIRCFDTKKDNELFQYKLEIDFDIEINKLVDNKTEELIMLQTENIDIITRTYLEDLIVNDIPISRAMMYGEIIRLSKTLSPVHYEMFYLVYIENKSGREIHNELMSKTDKCMGYRELLKVIVEMKKELNNKVKCLR